jgi:hypothetical protein
MWWSKQKWNDRVTPKNGHRGGFGAAGDNFTDEDAEAAETALFEGVRACEEELPFN